MPMVANPTMPSSWSSIHLPPWHYANARMLRRSSSLASLTLASVLATAACSSTAATSTNSVLIVDKTFDLKSADPHRELSVTGAMISKALYDTLPSVASARYRRPNPFYRRIVVRNMDSPTQLVYITSSINEIALDLSEVQAESLNANRSLRVNASTGPDIVFLFANANPQVSQVTADKHFENAVRDALDYRVMVALMGLGAVQARGVIPNATFGALPAWTAPRRDLAAARTVLAASGINDPTRSLPYGSDQYDSGR